MTATYAPTVFSTQVGIQGPPGNGAPGTTTRDGTGAPANSLGIDGDYYINHANGDLWKRVSGTYNVVGSLVGPQGIQGPAGTSASWRSGIAAPNDTVGIDGDLYLVTSSGDLYQRVSGHYTLITNIRGPQGIQGLPGSILRNGTGAPSNGTGVDGDYHLNTTTGALYQRQSGTYALVGNLMGPQGIQGLQGPQGSILRNGSAAPSNGTGVDGDYYLVSTTGALYQRISGSYASVGNLTGPQGPIGPAATVPVTTIASSGASQALTFAPTGDKACYITVSQALALSVTAPSTPTGAKQQIVCYLINPSGYPVSPPAAGGSVVYPNGTPNISGSKARIVFETDGNSTTIWGGV